VTRANATLMIFWFARVWLTADHEVLVLLERGEQFHRCGLQTRVVTQARVESTALSAAPRSADQGHGVLVAAELTGHVVHRSVAEQHGVRGNVLDQLFAFPSSTTLAALDGRTLLPAIAGEEPLDTPEAPITHRVSRTAKRLIGVLLSRVAVADHHHAWPH